MSLHHYPPKRILIILFAQLIGMVMLASTQYGGTPIKMFILFSAGSGLIAGSFFIWVFLMLREFRMIKNEVQTVFKKVDPMD